MSHFVPLFSGFAHGSLTPESLGFGAMLSWRYSCHSEKRNVVMTKSMLFELNV